ncbi:MAG: PorV/PorQ family protein [Bacteroidota bacterium]
MISRAALYVFAIQLLAALPLNAQIDKKAQVGFRFLENPVAADAIGRGATGVVGTMNAGALFWNPSEIGWLKGTADVMVHRTQGIADINYNAAAATFNLWDFGVLGVSLLFMDYGTFYGTRRADNAEGYVETGTFSPKAYALGLAFSQQVSDRFSYGVQVKMVQQDLGSAWVAPTGSSITDPSLAISKVDYSKGDVAFDVGAFYDFHYMGIRFGASLLNLSRDIKYENEAFPMPFVVSFGATLEPLQAFMDGDAAHDLVLAFETRHPRDFNETVQFGGEYTVMGVVVARAGYMLNYDERGLTAGLGVRYDWDGVPLRADYAYEAFGVFGGVHHFTLGVKF